MAVYPNTGSLFTASNLKNRTGVALSTMVIIKANNITVGAIQKIDIGEKRTVKMMSEVGTDGIVDSSPVSSTTYSGSCERLRYDGVRIFQAFGCGFLHLKSMRIPIDIDIIDTYTATQSDPDNVAGSIITTLKNVWFTSLDYSYTQDNWQVSDRANFEFETIYSHINGASDSAPATGGARGLPLTSDVYEQSADRGARRGALDLPGLITVGFSA